MQELNHFYPKLEEKKLSLLKECYQYFENKHITNKKLDTINHLIDFYLTSKEDDKVEFLLREYESESKEYGIKIPPKMFQNLDWNNGDTTILVFYEIDWFIFKKKRGE